MTSGCQMCNADLQGSAGAGLNISLQSQWIVCRFLHSSPETLTLLGHGADLVTQGGWPLPAHLKSAQQSSNENGRFKPRLFATDVLTEEPFVFGATVTAKEHIPVSSHLNRVRIGESISLSLRNTLQGRRQRHTNIFFWQFRNKGGGTSVGHWNTVCCFNDHHVWCIWSCT